MKLFWSLEKDDTNKLRLLIPVEVKSIDAELVRQAASYGRALNSAIPLRAFELVLGYNCAQDRFRFFIFHRGGLTSSKGISLKNNTPSNRAALVRVFMSIMSWANPGHAGYPPFANGKTFNIPDPHNINQSLSAAVNQVLYRSQGLRSRNTWVACLNYSVPATDPDLHPATVMTRVRLRQLRAGDQGSPLSLGSTQPSS